MKRFTQVLMCTLMLGSNLACHAQVDGDDAQSKPMNIVIAISDDQSWPHTSFVSEAFVHTPNLEAIAAEGVQFTNGYAASPGCSPSRAALLLGTHHWMNGPAGTHGSSFPAHYTTFTDLLDEAGYKVGFTGKGWGPGEWKQGGRDRNPAGDEFNDILLTTKVVKGISKKDYAANFEQFLNERKEGQPFFFWYGAHEPHLKYADKTYSDQQRASVVVPPFLPDTPTVRDTLLDYANEITHFDDHLGKIFEQLKQRGELQNTLVIVTSDNGMPFPKAKATGYDYGIHVPMVVYWPGGASAGEVVDTPVSFVDLSATIVQAAGLKVPANYSGDSLVPLVSKGINNLDPNRSVYAGRERQTAARYHNLSYPVRSMRQGDYLLVWNMKPDRLPSGQGQELIDGTLGEPDAAYYDVGPSRIKFEILARRSEPSIAPFFNDMVRKRSEWQLFNLNKDPACMNNLANDPDHASLLAQYQNTLKETLKETGDPRVLGYGIVFENYPRSSGKMRYFPKPEQSNN